MAPRKKTAIVQLKVRMKEPLRAKIEKAAKSKGVSINSEIVDRLEQSILVKNAVSFFFGEATTLDEAIILHDYLMHIKVATSSTGERPDFWTKYVKHAPFAFDDGDQSFDIDAMTDAIRPKVDERLMKVEADVKKKGQPTLMPEMYEVLPGETRSKERDRMSERRHDYKWALRVLYNRPVPDRTLRKQFPNLFVGVDAIRDGTLDIGD